MQGVGRAIVEHLPDHNPAQAWGGKQGELRQQVAGSLIACEQRDFSAARSAARWSGPRLR